MAINYSENQPYSFMDSNAATGSLCLDLSRRRVVISLFPLMSLQLWSYTATEATIICCKNWMVSRTEFPLATARWPRDGLTRLTDIMLSTFDWCSRVSRSLTLRNFIMHGLRCAFLSYRKRPITGQENRWSPRNHFHGTIATILPATTSMHVYQPNGGTILSHQI
ncbi:hypothetical protein DFS33DRAFT_1297659 [Desarmillaria ectypa]|nr:hypothetical protein DFS33DRAFT_1297659 [Desarmillaria ectypa]